MLTHSHAERGEGVGGWVAAVASAGLAGFQPTPSNHWPASSLPIPSSISAGAWLKHMLIFLAGWLAGPAGQAAACPELEL